ncbi:MAG: hypothetical protein HYY29_01875 [Chloroflexi bacterium]|nr:hypothetical protein [Chloroflexota bacterium]
MFYPTQAFKAGAAGAGSVSALVVLNVSESKRLIARAVAALPEIKTALCGGTVIISRGITDAYVAEEITGVKIPVKAQYTAGCIAGGELTVNASPDRLPPYVLRDGKPARVLPSEALKSFTADDVFIKGASALDREGNAAVLVAHEMAGTMGESLAVVVARGAHFIAPVGLEKLVPCVTEALPKCGIYRFKYATGLPCGLFPMFNARVITEIQAIEVLAGVTATQVAAGGVGGSEGAVVLAIEGPEENLERAFDLIKSVKGQPADAAPAKVAPPAASFGYDARAIWHGWKTSR